MGVPDQPHSPCYGLGGARAHSPPAQRFRAHLTISNLTNDPLLLKPCHLTRVSAPSLPLLPSTPTRPDPSRTSLCCLPASPPHLGFFSSPHLTCSLPHLTCSFSHPHQACSFPQVSSRPCEDRPQTRCCRCVNAGTTGVVIKCGQASGCGLCMSHGNLQESVTQRKLSWRVSGSRSAQSLSRSLSSSSLKVRQRHSIANGLATGPMLPSMLAEAASRPLAVPEVEVAAAGPSSPTLEGRAATDVSGASASGADAVGSLQNSTSAEAPLEAEHRAGRRSPSSGAVPSAAALALADGGIRVLCRSRAQVEAACEVPWL